MSVKDYSMHSKNETLMSSDMSPDHIDQYREEGYTIIRNVFNEKEIAALASACDTWKWLGELHGRTWRKGNTVIWVNNDDQEAPLVQGMQWPSYHDQIFNDIRCDRRLMQIAEPFIGNSLKQIINQVHWKKPGSNVTWALHRDVRSRRPRSDFRNLAKSWMQTGIAIDPHRPENGAMQIVPGSHKDCSHNPDDHNHVTHNPEYDNDPRKIDVVLDPGDVAIWNAFTIHGGGLNTTTDQDRRVYINGFINADDCDRGELTWLNGNPVQLSDKPALIQFDEINEKTEAFYTGKHAEMVRD